MIVQEVTKISNSLGHFPSVADLRQMGRNDLSCAMTKRGGYRFWSKQTGFQPIFSDSDLGWEGEKNVSEILKSKGFDAKERQELKCPYDILVNKRIRIDVKSAKAATYNNGYTGWFYRIGKSVSCDIVIFYRFDEKDCFIVPWYELGETNITIMGDSKYEIFRERYDIIEKMSKTYNELTF